MYRLIKLEKIRQFHATVRMQKIIRGFIQRRKYKRNYRLLIKQREVRIRAKRQKSAIIVQCAFRIYRAKKRVGKQRLLVAEREKERKEIEMLEASIQGLHSRWMDELMAIRAQTGVRKMLAKK
jgi:hypothetical protein